NTDRELARLTLEKSAELWDFLADQGVHYQPSLGGTLSLGRTNAFFLGGGKTMLNSLYRTAENLGVAIRYETMITDVDINDGHFKSAQTEHAGRSETIHAKSLVVASGGFEANTEWLREAWGPVADNFLIRGTPYNRGELLKVLLDKGIAQTGDATQG